MNLSHNKAGLVCFLAGVLVYVNTLNCEFCYDDKAAIMDNHDLHPNSPWSKLWVDDFWGIPLSSNVSHKSYRPLCVATFRLNYLLHELEPMGYHLVNILLHGVVCYLYVQLCGLVLREVWPTLIAGLLFAVHPIHTEAVASVVGRADLMAALFFVGSFLAYHFSAIRQWGTASFGWLLCSLLLSLCSVLSKENGLTVMAVCIVYDYFLLHRNTLSTSVGLVRQLSKLRQIPEWAYGFVMRVTTVGVFTCSIVWVRLWMNRTPPHFTSKDNEALSLGVPYRQLHWAYMMFVNSALLLNPSRLVHDYRMSAIPLITSVFDGRNLLTLLTLTVYAVLGLYSSVCSVSHHTSSTSGHGHQKELSTHSNGLTKTIMRNGVMFNKVTGHPQCLGSSHQYGYSSKQVLMIGLSLLILPFLPATNLFVTVGFVVAERVLYLPSMGLCLLVAYGVWKMMKKCTSSILIKMFLVALLVAHSAKTVSRNRDWSSKITIFSSLLKHYPNNGHILANLAREYRNLGEFGRAEEAYRIGTNVAPNVSINFINLGSLLQTQHRFAEAEKVLFSAKEMLERTLNDAPENPGKLTGLYVSLSALVGRNSDRLEEALELVDQCLAFNENVSTAHNSRGSLLLRLGRLHEAERAFKRALELNATNTNALYNIALTHKERGDVRKSVAVLEDLLKVDSTHRLAQGVLYKLRQSLSF